MGNHPAARFSDIANTGGNEARFTIRADNDYGSDRFWYQQQHDFRGIGLGRQQNQTDFHNPFWFLFNVHHNYLILRADRHPQPMLCVSGNSASLVNGPDNSRERLLVIVIAWRAWRAGGRWRGFSNPQNLTYHDLDGKELRVAFASSSQDSMRLLHHDFTLGEDLPDNKRRMLADMAYVGPCDPVNLPDGIPDDWGLTEEEDVGYFWILRTERNRLTATEVTNMSVRVVRTAAGALR